jgi:tetratricopeptide (TPR) repeat protein
MSSPANAKASKNDQLFQKALDLKFNQHFSEAEKILKKIAKDDPKHENAYMAMAEIQADTGRHDIALNNLSKVVKLNPSHQKAWRHMGFISLYVKNDMSRSLEFLTRALHLDQTDPEVYRMMGYLSQQLNQFDDSIELLEIGLQLSPSHPEILSYLGMSYLRQRRFDEAKEKIIQALKINPQNANIVMNAMRADELLELSEEHLAILHKAMDMHRNSNSLKELIRMHDTQKLVNNKKYDEALKILKDVNDSGEKQGIAKYFQMGKIYQSKGESEKAFDSFTKANTLQANTSQARKYKKEGLPNTMAREVQVLTKDFVEKLEVNIYKHQISRPYQDPVFLVGFPRSGTTLSGQILDSHPKLITADEYGAIDQIKIYFHQKYKKQLPDKLPEVNKEELQYMHDLYNTKQSGLPVQHKDKLFVDKMPLNTTHATLIHAIFPKAKILFVHRHPLDSILSGYMQFFAMNAAMAHFNNIEDMAKLYLKMMQTWKHQKEMLPIDYHEYKYENVVADFDSQVGKILDFVGVGWDDAVRDFHKNTAGPDGPKTLTPSRTQVNKGIYKGAQNRWKKYENHLQPAIDILGDTILEMGYEL